MRLLIIEDEPFIAADLEGLALDLGYCVAGIADSKANAFDLAETLGPDAALVDIKLKDGFTGAEVAQALGERFKVPFAFVSGNTETLPAGAYGAVAVIQKPFTDAQIVAVLKALAQPGQTDARG